MEFEALVCGNYGKRFFLVKPVESGRELDENRTDDGCHQRNLVTVGGSTLKRQ